MMKERTVLIFGYPLAIQHLGGLVWIKKVVNYLDQSGKFCVKKISNRRESHFYRLPFISDIRALIRGIFSNPDIAMLDTYGEAAIWMWILLRLFCPRTKIATVFHHYEPLSVRHKGCTPLSAKYYALLDLITKIMLRNSDKIITVSKSSMRELKALIEIKIDKKIAVVGCSCTGYFSAEPSSPKDIDFLCIGRIEKFSEIENIWKEIRKKKPGSKFVMAGRCSSNDITCLRRIGIDHHGIVSDMEKIDLYRRAKVFLFPSLFEGFGIAIGEALSAKMIVIAWKIPAFEERFPCQSNANLRLINVGDKEIFVKNALEAINDYDRSDSSKISTENFGITQTWDEVGKNVVNAFETTLT
ncbi:MAG TPA: glycosyltransferase [Nitrososphaeraceae archaeon]|nr:glycosyltransferase [Nitrososphaeraceae archaeon]